MKGGRGVSDPPGTQPGHMRRSSPDAVPNTKLVQAKNERNVGTQKPPQKVVEEKPNRKRHKGLSFEE